MLRPRNSEGPGRADASALVALAQAGDAGARERVLDLHMGLVLRIGARVAGRYVQVGRDEEISVGLMALNEAIDRFRPDAGVSFSAFAEVVVRRRLIDQLRKESARRETPFTDFEQEGEDGDVWSPVELRRAQEIDRERREAEDRRAEIDEFQRLLRPYGVTLADLVRQSPQHIDARERAIGIARRIAARPDWAEHLRRHHALPLRELEAVADLGVSRKTLERQRKFIIAVAVILMEGLHALRSFLPGG